MDTSSELIPSFYAKLPTEMLWIPTF